MNKTYVEKLGYTLPETLTWDFIWEVSEAATKKNSDGTYAVNGQDVMIPFIYKSTDNMMIEISGRERCSLFHGGGGDRSFQQHDEGFPFEYRRAHEDGSFFHLQDLRLSGQLPQCGPVHFRH